MPSNVCTAGITVRTSINYTVGAMRRRAMAKETITSHNNITTAMIKTRNKLLALKTVMRSSCFALSGGNHVRPRGNGGA